MANRLNNVHKSPTLPQLNFPQLAPPTSVQNKKQVTPEAVDIEAIEELECELKNVEIILKFINEEFQEAKNAEITFKYINGKSCDNLNDENRKIFEQMINLTKSWRPSIHFLETLETLQAKLVNIKKETSKDIEKLKK